MIKHNDILNRISGGVEYNSDYLILSTTDDSLIERAMKDCDSAFTISVINRENFDELFRKITAYAVTLIMTEKSTKEIVGYEAFYANDQKTGRGYITLICIKPEFQRRGLGSGLIDQSFDICRAKGMHTVALEVLKQDRNALNYYRSKGFNITSESDHDSYYMEREV